MTSAPRPVHIGKVEGGYPVIVTVDSALGKTAEPVATGITANGDRFPIALSQSSAGFALGHADMTPVDVTRAAFPYIGDDFMGAPDHIEEALDHFVESFRKGAHVEVRVPEGTDVRARHLASPLLIAGRVGSCDIADATSVTFDVQEREGTGSIRIKRVACFNARVTGSRKLDLDCVDEVNIASLAAIDSEVINLVKVRILRAHLGAEVLTARGGFQYGDIRSHGGTTWDIGPSTYLALEGEDAGGTVNGPIDFLWVQGGQQTSVVGTVSRALMRFASEDLDLSRASFNRQVSLHTLAQRPLRLQASPSARPQIAAVADAYCFPPASLHGSWAEIVPVDRWQPRQDEWAAVNAFEERLHSRFNQAAVALLNTRVTSMAAEGRLQEWKNFTWSTTLGSELAP